MLYRSQPYVELYWISAWRDGRAAAQPASSHAGRGNIREGSTLSSVPDERDASGMRPAHQDSISLPLTYVDWIATVTQKKKKKRVLNYPSLTRKCDIVALDEEKSGEPAGERDGGLAQEGIVAWQQLSTFAKWNENGYCESKCSFTLGIAIFQGGK